MFRSCNDRSVSGSSFQIKEEVQSTYNTANNSFSCDLCGKGPWSAELDVDIHRKMEHQWDLLKALKDENIHMCSICLREQKDHQSLIEHILVNHFCCPPNANIIMREVYICDHCQRLFFNKQLLTIHIIHWHIKKTPENAKKRYPCPTCFKTVPAKSLWFHLLYHGIYNAGTCPVCLKICENHSEMLEHMKTHPNLLRCDICRFQTTKECYFNTHIEKHKKATTKEGIKYFEPIRFFLPEHLPPSLSNRMFHIFKGIPLANEVKICILCRMLVFSFEEMHQHVHAAHMPEEKVKSKTYRCYCGEEFFNNILLKQHVFKLKGNHGVWDGVEREISPEVEIEISPEVEIEISPVEKREISPGIEIQISPGVEIQIPPNPATCSIVQDELINVYQIYGINDPMEDDVVIAIQSSPDEGEGNIFEYEVLKE